VKKGLYAHANKATLGYHMSGKEKSPDPNQIQFLIQDFIQSCELVKHVENERWKITEFYFLIMVGLFTLFSALTKEYGQIIQQFSIALAMLLILSSAIILVMLVKLRIEFVERMENIVRIRKTFDLKPQWDYYALPDFQSGPKYIKFGSVHMMSNFLIIVPTGIVSGTLLGYALGDMCLSILLIVVITLVFSFYMFLLHLLWRPLCARDC